MHQLDCTYHAQLQTNCLHASTGCAAGKYLLLTTDYFLLTTCMIPGCAAGKYSDLDGLPACIDCPAGRFTPVERTPESSLCIPCFPGQFGDQPGTTACIVCVSGTFSAELNSTSCTACSKGGCECSGIRTYHVVLLAGIASPPIFMGKSGRGDGGGG